MAIDVNVTQIHEDDVKDTEQVTDKLGEVMGQEPDMFLANAIISLEGKSMAAKRTKARELAAQARLYETQANIAGDRYNLKKWNQVAFALKTLK